jgi:hypothetical protein
MDIKCNCGEEIPEPFSYFKELKIFRFICRKCGNVYDIAIYDRYGIRIDDVDLFKKNKKDENKDYYEKYKQREDDHWKFTAEVR